mgnify:CR=1 FL=1
MLLWSVIDPRGLWEVTSSWQFRNPEANEPSDSAFAVQRFFAFVALLMMVGGRILRHVGVAQECE